MENMFNSLKETGKERKKKMKLKLRDVLEIYSTLKDIVDSVTNINASFKFKLLTIMVEIKPFYENFEQIKNEKIMEYGEKNEDGNIFISVENKEAFEKFNADISELLDNEVEVSVDKFSAEDIMNKGLSSEYLIRLYSIIEN